MDNLKEQILEYTEQVIVAYQSRIDNTIDSDALRKVLEEYPEKIVKAFKANNFVQLQAGEDGLVKKESRCVKCRAGNNGECFDIECTTHSYERGFKDGTVDQKALCDKEKEEVVKKVFKELRGD